MENESGWAESKAKERSSQNFVRTLFDLSGYEIMDFGIENHKQEIIKQIKTNYKPETNRRLLSMPDFVVMDKESKETWIIEVKNRNYKEYFDMKKSNVAFKWGHMKDYLDFWKDATLILTFNVSPYCLCVDFNQVNWNIHFKEKFQNSEGNFDELWNFCGIYQIINKKFPKVTEETFKKTLYVLGIKN
ncbi:MAG: hypothetical protein WC494_01545 [Candidatus Pacearchaeota archaeon]